MSTPHGSEPGASVGTSASRAELSRFSVSVPATDVRVNVDVEAFEERLVLRVRERGGHLDRVRPHGRQSVGEQVLRGAVTAPPQVFALCLCRRDPSPPAWTAAKPTPRSPRPRPLTQSTDGRSSAASRQTLALSSAIRHCQTRAPPRRRRDRLCQSHPRTLGPRAAYSASRLGSSLSIFEGAPALRARIFRSRSACPGWMLASSVSERLGAAGSVGEQVRGSPGSRHGASSGFRSPSLPTLVYCHVLGAL